MGFGLAFSLPDWHGTLCIGKSDRHVEELPGSGVFRGIDQVTIALPIYCLHRVITTALTAARRRDDDICAFTGCVPPLRC